MGLQFQLMPSMERFQIYSNFKCIHNSMVHQGEQNVKN